MSANSNQSRFSLNIQGYGCISALGLESADIYQACVERKEPPVQSLERQCGEQKISYPTRPVDKKPLRSILPKHPRLRRSSSVTKYSMAAVLSALDEEKIEKIRKQELTIGIVVTFLNGCVNYSNKFYSEVLDDPTVASPILFPETVYNAPASHIASFLNSFGPAYSLIGDSAAWFSGLRIAHDWIDLGLVDGCLVISAEELDWLSSEGLSLISSTLVGTEGAAAVYVDKSDMGTEIQVNGSFDYRNAAEKKAAIQLAYDAIPSADTSLLVNGLVGIHSLDQEEQSSLETWQGDSLSPFETMGHPMAVAGGFQTIVALEALNSGHSQAAILAKGGNQHAYSAVLK